MKSNVKRELNSMSRDTCGKFRPKLEACIMAQGGVFKK